MQKSEIDMGVGQAGIQTDRFLVGVAGFFGRVVLQGERPLKPSLRGLAVARFRRVEPNRLSSALVNGRRVGVHAHNTG